MTPFPVPIHNLLTEIINDVMRTKENPNFPVPKNIKLDVVNGHRLFPVKNHEKGI